jgi:translation initiation factor 1
VGDDRRLVYSTDGSLPLPPVARPAAKSAPRSGGPQFPDDGYIRVGCERRRGGSVTLVYGLVASELATVGAELKRRCGTGGTIKDGTVVLQGDKRDAAIAYFTERKRRTKRMGRPSTSSG